VYLKEHPEIRQKIDAALREKIGLPKLEQIASKPAAPEPSRATAQTA